MNSEGFYHRLGVADLKPHPGGYGRERGQRHPYAVHQPRELCGAYLGGAERRARWETGERNRKFFSGSSMDGLLASRRCTIKFETEARALQSHGYPLARRGPRLEGVHTAAKVGASICYVKPLKKYRVSNTQDSWGRVCTRMLSLQLTIN